MNPKPGDLVIQATKSDQTYAEVLPHIKTLVKTADMKICKPVISEIKKLIKDRKCTPMQKLLALNLFQECMMLKNIHFLTFAQSKILDRLSILAQKKKEDVFRDSNKTQDNLLASQAFIQNLLTYIQIWAQQYGRGASGEPTPYSQMYAQLSSKRIQHRWAQQYGRGTSGEPTAYSQMYAQLSSKVKFPQANPAPVKPIEKKREPPQQYHSVKPIEKKREPPQQYHQPEPKRASIRVSRTDKETLEYLENLLAIIEEIVNPHGDETGKELIANMMQIKPTLEMLLNSSISNDDFAQTEKLLALNDRVQKIVDIKPQSREERKTVHITLDSQAKTQEKRGSLHIEEEKLKSSTMPVRNEIKPQVEVKIPSNEPIKEESKRHATPPKASVNIFDNILDLDFEPITSPPSKTQFSTYHPSNPPFFASPGPDPFDFSSGFSQPNPPVIPNPPISSPVPNLTMSTNIPLQNNIPTPNLYMSGSYNNIQSSNLSNNLSEDTKIITDLKAEIASLQKSDIEKNEIIENLNKTILALKAKCESLESVVIKTKEILTAKEQECQEYHILKDQKPVEESDDFFGEILCSPRIGGFEQAIIPQEIHADNNDIFRYICSESLTVVHDCELFQLGVQLSNEDDEVKMSFYLGNKSVEALENIKVSIESTSAFDIVILESLTSEIQPNSQGEFDVSCRMKSFSSVYPRMSVKLISSNKAFSYSLKIPLSIGKYASPISLTPSSIWKEWDDMMFAGENTACKCTIARKYLPGILKFSDNILILKESDEKKIGKDKSMVVAKIGGLVVSMIHIKKVEGICEIEVRANDPQLRKNFMMLLVSHISD
ncbi:hypothetical protein SteCoe_22489 [Stentor coeruleus]|uniref:VHS domain-containing protein n=1 Tax=Stentor coeruleus TaxID=5963 RepID=A0A1R2BM23_9CILI|nr:hypothetical protein SteCoe_22489 [Stentor coeruleus]